MLPKPNRQQHFRKIKYKIQKVWVKSCFSRKLGISQMIMFQINFSLNFHTLFIVKNWWQLRANSSMLILSCLPAFCPSTPCENPSLPSFFIHSSSFMSVSLFQTAHWLLHNITPPAWLMILRKSFLCENQRFTLKMIFWQKLHMFLHGYQEYGEEQHSNLPETIWSQDALLTMQSPLSIHRGLISLALLVPSLSVK